MPMRDQLRRREGGHAAQSREPIHGSLEPDGSLFRIRLGPISMQPDANKTWRKAMLARIGLWGCSFVARVALFSFLCCLSNLSLRSFPTIFTVTVLLALPAWLLYVPLVVVLRSSNKSQIWVVLISGLFIGPAYLAGVGLIVQLFGGNHHLTWYGNGLDLGIIPSMPFAIVLGKWTCPHFWHKKLRLKIHRMENLSHGVITPEVHERV
jgi:hypothetical protein